MWQIIFTLIYTKLKLGKHSSHKLQMLVILSTGVSYSPSTCVFSRQMRPNLVLATRVSPSANASKYNLGQHLQHL